MRILALDFSSSQRCVAVVQPGTGVETTFQSEIIEAGGRATQAFHMIERALAEARLDREEIEGIAVGLGPGSYTGVRAAIALAQGWQLACGTRLVGINTVKVLAAQAQAEGLRGSVHIVVDAQRGEFYRSTWRLSETKRNETVPLCIVPRDEVESQLAGGDVVCGPDLKHTLPQARDLFPSARILGHLALAETEFVRGEDLKPVYLRKTSFVKAAPPRVI